ncbi:hypothetical protein [Paraburkholderia youngii]|uniref:Uncharacterized protein n=1 Tax=Paraburkholderia youngii TaxID=2782701 RepID=A0A7W8LD71_9BURK|nr:hypothetical protein [Paraburkholderia youngii]MBB5404440.1 hypothetical protein [Paraburkholderia youngii]
MTEVLTRRRKRPGEAGVEELLTKFYRKQLAARFAAWHLFTEVSQVPSVF